MATTQFTDRFFFSIPSELVGGITASTGTYIVSGSTSRLLINNTRTNLSVDSFDILSTNDPPQVGGQTASVISISSDGWWPGPSTNTPDPIQPGDIFQGVIVGGSDVLFANTGADGRTSYVSCWGFPITSSGSPAEDQDALNTEFIALAGNILGTTFANTASAKVGLRNAGYYYQWPRGFDGQSTNTGNGSDT